MCQMFRRHSTSNRQSDFRYASGSIVLSRLSQSDGNGTFFPRCSWKTENVATKRSIEEFAKDWVVYAKRPFGGPAQVLKYLARYTHRVAISNARLVKLDDGQVTFRYKDYADAQRQKTLTLSAEEFLRRFVQHVLPKGFVKIRHFGLLANRQRAQKLQLSRHLLLPVTVAAATTGAEAAALAAPKIEPAPVRHCPKCGGCRFIRIELPKEADVASAAGGDTS